MELPAAGRPLRSRRTALRAGALLVLAALLAAGPAPARAASEFERTLLRLAERALAEGDLREAESRYRRVLDANPGSATAQAGLGSVALEQGDAAAARRSFEAALALDAARTEAHLGLAELARRAGDPAGARERLRAGLAHAPLDALLHQRLFELTGLAPTGARAGPELVHALAEAHPYDPRVQLALARAEFDAGNAEAARAALETALLVADLAPAAAPEAAGLLEHLDSEERRFVPVHVFADESVRAQPGWEFELRIAWGRAARALAPMLRTSFVPISIEPFSTEGVPADLDSIHAAMLGTVARPPLEGILSGFTRRQAPGTITAHRLGQAAYLGRELVARIDPADRKGRTLTHEILHLYGAIHLSDEIPSLMNPVGGVWSLDRYNARIVEATRARRFGPGSLDRNVLSRVDAKELADALLAGLAVNVHIRNADLGEALEAAQTSRVVAGMQARKAMGQDRHLADVARLVAVLLARTDRAAEAVAMMENAARLYGPRSPEGREAQAEADRWRAAYKSFLRQ